MDSVTCDTLFNGKLSVCQEAKGYRFSLDAVLLAGLTRIKGQDRIIELGTGCGVIPLVLVHREKTTEKIIGIEIQPELARLAHRNVEDNGLDGRIEIHQVDLRQVSSHFLRESFDLVLANPPYRKPGTGRVNPNRQKAVARHELTATLPDIFGSAHYLLPRGGRVALIYPAARLAHLLDTARGQGFSPKRLRIIYSSPNDSARLVHVECRKGGGEEIRIESPFYIYRENGEYTDSMLELYGEG
jgi:tRNA1Val (adenine37-N6)-methyltransferase